MIKMEQTANMFPKKICTLEDVYCYSLLINYIKFSY